MTHEAKKKMQFHSSFKIIPKLSKLIMKLYTRKFLREKNVEQCILVDSGLKTKLKTPVREKENKTIYNLKVIYLIDKTLKSASMFL